MDFAVYNLVYASDWADSTTYNYIENMEDSAETVTLTNNSEYFWLVEAVDKDGLSTQSNDGEPMRLVVGTLDIYESNQVPNVYALHQNYPNPFNPSTRIQFDLPKQIDASLKVYDIMGREVAILINESMIAGYHRKLWEGRDQRGVQVPSGIYIARLITPEYSRSIKMLLLK